MKDLLHPQVLEGEAHAGGYIAGVPRNHEKVRTVGKYLSCGQTEIYKEEA